MEMSSPSITSNWLDSMNPNPLANNAPAVAAAHITNSESGGHTSMRSPTNQNVFDEQTL